MPSRWAEQTDHADAQALDGRSAGLRDVHALGWDRLGLGLGRTAGTCGGQSPQGSARVCATQHPVATGLYSA
jgi:hypothetical protein